MKNIKTIFIALVLLLAGSNTSYGIVFQHPVIQNTMISQSDLLDAREIFSNFCEENTRYWQVERFGMFLQCPDLRHNMWVTWEGKITIYDSGGFFSFKSKTKFSGVVKSQRNDGKK